MMKPKSEVAVKIVFALLVNVVVNPLLALWALNLLGRHLSTPVQIDYTWATWFAVWLFQAASMRYLLTKENR